MKKLSSIGLISFLVFLPRFSLAQYRTGIGIESVNSNTITDITIKRTIYTGECPGSSQDPQTAYFVSDSFPPAPGLRVKLANMSRGLSPDNPPYTDRSYSKGRASESFIVALGSKHQGRYFIVKPGGNLMQYEILKDGNRLDSGTFYFNVNVAEETEDRRKELVEVTKYDSNGKSYRATEYRCP